MMQFIFAALCRFTLLIGLGGAVSASASTLQLAPYDDFHPINFADYTDDQANVGSISAITQDNRGFMWVGGENGLIRYDGHSVVTYRTKNSNSLSANYVQDIIPDGDDYLWVATVQGINRLNFETGLFDVANQKSGKIPGDDVLSIALYKDLIFTATTEGLGVINRHTMQPKILPFMHQLPKLLQVRYVFVFQDTLWLGTGHKGLIEIDLTANTIHYYTHDPANPDNPNALPHSDVHGIFTYDGKTYWLASLGGGLIRFDYDQQKFTQYSSSPEADIEFVTNAVWGVHGDSHGYIWIGTDSSGLWRIDTKTLEVDGYISDPSIADSLASNKARVTFEDNANNIWAGHFSGSMDYYNREQEAVIRYKKSNRFHKGLNHPSVLSILPTNTPNYWVGTEGGLNLIDPKAGSKLSLTKENSGMLSDAVLALESDQSGHLWIGTWGGGLQRYNPVTQQWLNLLTHPDDNQRIPSAHIWALENDNKGHLWVGSQKKGVYKMRLRDGHVTHYPFNIIRTEDKITQRGIIGEHVRDITLDIHGNLWVSSTHGLSRYNPELDKFDLFTHDPKNPQSLASNQVISLLGHTNGDLWIGFRDAGLSIYHTDTQTFEHFGIPQGLPSTNVASLLEDDNGNVWIGSPSSLVKISSDLQNLKTYTRVHGLAGANHNRNGSFLDDSGRVWMGSKGGLSIFHPSSLEKTQLSNGTVISGIRINHGKSYDSKHWKSEYSEALNYDQNAISFEFSLNQFYLPQLNEYRYRLKGLDEKWQNTIRHNFANYTNLDPGNYTFEVKGKSANAAWSEQVTQLSFTINPPPWRQWWAYLLYLCFASAGFAGYRNYMSIRSRSAIYEQLSQQDQLTQLPNRVALHKRIEQWQRQSLPFSVIVADLDHFKQINDTYGHEAGDLLLKEFSRIAAAEIRDCDLLGRWGGEEFLIICQTHEIEVIYAVAERIQKTMAMQSFAFHQQLIQMTVSFGCATRQESENFNDLFHRADQALYDAKAKGRNRVVKAA